MSVAGSAGCNGVSGHAVCLGIARGIGGHNRIGKDIAALYSSAQDCIDQTGLSGAWRGRIATEGWQRRRETSTIGGVVDNASGADGSQIGTAPASLARIFERMKFGMAIPAMTMITATTIKSSIKVKPADPVLFA